MAPNPVAVLRSYVDGVIELDDWRIETLIKINWVTPEGELTEDGKAFNKYGWAAAGYKDMDEALKNEKRTS